tara:strand:+ start:322 stop:513 length:192 start_codon:yes stop_codon:yes gene_type:complete
MGRIKTGFVKTTAVKIYKRYKDKFSNDFDNNKKSLDEVAQVNSKKLRNVIAGYIVTLVKRDSK